MNSKSSSATANNSIKCTVQQCEHNHCQQNCCTLNSIQVGTHEANPTQPQCVDCNSFKVKTN